MSKMADDDPWLLKEDGYLNVDTECKSIIYHDNLNVLLITTGSAQVYVVDVNSGVILQKSSLSGKLNGKLQGAYLSNGVDKVLYTDGRGIGVRSDYNGVLLLDTLLQTTVSRSEDVIKLELLFSEATLLYQCLRCVELPGVDHVQEVIQELASKTFTVEASQKKGVKAQKWNTVCLELPHGSLKLVCSGLVMELKRLNRHIPALPIASAINERLNGLLPGLALEGGPVDRALMFSEVMRRDTFSKWPHMNYKWALPDQMAHVGFYHHPNAKTQGDDRVMCFTCNCCLVCWEPKDEPWSEHERHSPACPFVKGEYTQNVPLSVTLATAPAREAGDTIDVISTTNASGLVATASSSGFISVWNVTNQLKREVSFYVAPVEQEINNKESIQFGSTRNLTSYLRTLNSETDSLSDYKHAASHKVQITALSVVGSPNCQSKEAKTLDSTLLPGETSDSKIRPCVVCAVTVTVSNPSQLRTLENVWAASTDLAPSSSLVRAMNSVNSAASDTLDIMKVAGDRYTPSRLHYLVLYDFYHKIATTQPIKEDNTKDSKTKKTLSGTGTSASSNGERQGNFFQDFLLGKFLYEVPIVPVIEDVDSDIVVGPHFDNIFPTTTLTASSSNGIYSKSISFTVPPTSSSFDANFNPINGPEQFASTSDLTTANKKSLDIMKITKTEPVVIKTLPIEAPDYVKITYIGPSIDGRHLYVAMCPTIDNTDSLSSNNNQMDIDEDNEFFPQKGYMYWDHNDTHSGRLINGEIHDGANNANAILLVYALDFSGQVVKVCSEPVARQELPADQAPIEHVFLPLQEKDKCASSEENSTKSPNTNSNTSEPIGQVALVCRDGVIRVLNLDSLKTVTEARVEGKKFVSVAYCNSLERLCACTSDGALHFFVTTDEEDSMEDKEDVEDVNMMGTEENGSKATVPSTSTSFTFQDQLIAHKPSLSHSDLRILYELTRFDRHSPAYGATVPPCWNEMMQGQKQRRYPQHLHQSKDQHHTRIWRLHNEWTTWDEHVFELTLPRSASENIGHVDVRFSLHSVCQELPIIQITLLKQNVRRIGHNKSPLNPVDERIDFNIGNEQKGKNPVTTEEYQRQHNTEILCGPIELHRYMDLSCRSGCVTLTSPKLFRSKARTLLVHIKALIDPTKDGVTTKSKTNLSANKPPTSKKLRIVEVVRPPVPGSTAERFVEGPNSKKLDCYIGCDWIHEISITVRTVYPTNIPNERAQRCAMLESKTCFDNLLSVACLETSDKSPIAQSLALDILIWIASIRLTRLRSSQNNIKIISFQMKTIRSVQSRLPNLLKTCLLHAGRSIAHKCIKLVILCSKYVSDTVTAGDFYHSEHPPFNFFDEALVSVLVKLLPSIIEVQWAGSLRWLQLLITRILPLDSEHSIALQCVTLIQQIAAEISNRVNPYHLLLATRFGLYNNPFETELFDFESPMPPKYNPIPSTYVSAVTNEQAEPPTASSSSVYSQDAIDLRDLLTLPTHPATELVVPSKLKALCTNHSMKGLLEVEPLHFTCHAASDGTKMEKIDPCTNSINIGAPLYDSTATNSNGVPDIKTIHHTYNLDAGSLGSDVQAKSTPILSDLLSLCTGRTLKKPVPQLIFTPDNQSDCDETNDMSVSNQTWHDTQSDMPNSHILSSTVTKEKSSVQNLSTTVNRVEDSNSKKRDDITFPWGRLLCWPPQQALVVDRMHSGARRFVILDFGSPVLLTDLMIPCCSDLASLSVDIWTKSEEVDGTRLIVASDIENKPLVVCDLQPPPVCRYLKITTIGRYGMSPTMCKIPLGMFYGHMVVLPGEDYAELNNTSQIFDMFDPSVQTTIDTQCNILSALAEDVQCRFSLATERLKSLLDPLLCSETTNVMHMQHYLCYNKISSENKEQPSAKILATYQECIMFQHQLNVVRSVWRRLESWKGSQNVPTMQLSNAPSDKLRVLGETLLDILLYTVYEIGPVMSIPMSICDVFTPTVCEKFFHSICVVTPVPRLQLHAVALLARMAGHQPWWGNFLSNTLINLYSSSSTHIFPQDRVFILLTFLGRKSLIAGVNRSSVIDAMVRTLGKLLTPLSNAQTSSTNRLDVTLIGWVLLFLSVCLDTVAIPPPCLEGNNEKSREQSLLSRWEFIQGESAMQRKYGSANRSPASCSYRKKIQKRLMHHKQQLQELEQAKKAFHPSSQGWESLSSYSALLHCKMEASLKSQERLYKKTFKQHSAKHLKDILSVRKNDAQHASRSPRAQPQATTSSSKPEIMDLDIEYISNLSHQHVLPVARGLIALILCNSANVDMFLLACKVVARLVISTRPAISLCELMSEEQLLKLVRLATGTSDAAWSSHAVSSLLQDLLEGGKLFPKACPTHEGSPAEEGFESLVTEKTRTTEDDTIGAAGTSSAIVTLGNDEEFATGEVEEDTQDTIVVTPAIASTPKSNGFLPSLLESDDSELEEFLDDILERGRNMLKKGNPVSKTSSSISLAMDSRLEYGLEMGLEISLRLLSTFGMYNLPQSINATIHVPMESNRYSQQSSSRVESGWNDRTQDVWNLTDTTASSLLMLTRCFDKIVTDLYLQSVGTNLELVLQLWLTLNFDASSEQSNSSNQFDPSLTPVIPLSSTAISSLISALSWHPGVSLRAWCLALQCLTLASNQPLQTDSTEAANSRQPLDGLLGGMAGCIVKERNMGPMLLRLLSGSGLNINAMDKQYIMAGPTVCQALQDFLVRLEMRCDVITPGSSLGNTLKELLLWVVYQLVQPGGALSSRKGPLDAQYKLITSLTNLHFANTDLGTAMSVTECVGVLVFTYVRGSGVGAQCGGSVDLANPSGGFSGLFACVLGGDTRQGRPASWDTLVVALIKLVCRLIQTPLPNSCAGRSDSSMRIDLSETNLGLASDISDAQMKINISQTDESKVAEQQSSSRLQQSTLNKPNIRCVADTVLQHEPTMMRLLGALGHSTGSSLAMLLGESAGAGTATELGDPASIPDATFQLLTTLTKKASNRSLVLNPLYQYLSSSSGQRELDRQLGVMQLSEPLLWYILRVLDNEMSLAMFTAMGGVRVLCENLVKSSIGEGNGSPASPGVIALVMEHLSNAPNVVPAASASGKKSANTLETHDDGLLNFAPLGTISWLNPTAQPADVLIQNATPHKRARTAAWMYHCYPDEAWVDLTITLPCAILLRKVELQPHLTSLATCPSAVAIEVSRESNSPLTPVCPPMPTAGLTFICITLSQPEVATSVLVRLYKPRDSTNISLSQIKLLGTTAFGEIKTSHDTIDEEQLTKTSLGWLRLLHQCLSVSTLNSNLAVKVLNSAASVEGLIEACCNLLLLPAPSLFTPNLERVLLQLGLYSRELGLRLIGLLLNNRSTPFFQGAVTTQETSTVQLVVELLQQLCSIQDSCTEARMVAVLSWLQASALNGISRPTSGPNAISPPAVYIHCVSSIIWKAHQQQNLNYDLQALLTDELFNALYRWTLTLDTGSALKQAIDSALCAFCYVRPTLFPLLLQRVRILVPNMATDHSASISDDCKEREGQIDDKKSEITGEEWYCRYVLCEYKRLNLTEGQLLTVAAAARSPPGIQQLIDSGLPALLMASITDFCNLEESRRQQQQSRRSSSDDCCPSNSMAGSSLTDNDKAGETSMQTNNHFGGLCLTDPESIAMVLEFLTLVCSEGRMRDWLGKEGCGFWLPLLSLLSSRPIENPSVSSSRCSKTNISYSSLESAMIKFLSRCCWCHLENQKLLAELLTDVISQQRTTSNVRYLHGISGFTRRLILQLLLEGEKVLVSVTSEAPMKVSNTAANYSMPSMPPHPAHPLGHYHQLLYMSTQSTVADILQQVSGTWLLLLLPNTYKGNEAGSTNNRSRELWESGMAFIVDTLSVAAGNTAKDKRAKEASNRSQARAPTVRKSRLNFEGTSNATKPTSNNVQQNPGSSTNQQYLIHSSRPNTPLPPRLTIAQLLAIAEDSGISLSEPCLHLMLRQRNKDSTEDLAKQNDIELLNYRSIESSLGVFSAGGGLAVLARHLPLIYPDSRRPPPVAEKSPPPEQTYEDWVELEDNDNMYELLEVGGANSSTQTSSPAPYVPPHSLAAFGLFLRLPGYAEVLLRHRKRAQCLLRLALGVSDDGEGGDVLTSPWAASLPTLPFQVLRQVLDATPPTTDDGLLLRKTTIEVGAMLLLLNCLAIFTHQTNQNENSEQKGSGGQGEAGRSDENSHLYWAKGTGFGTGSTQQSWNVEQALLRQKSEEEHVTVLLQVLASYIGPGGQKQRELPSPFPDLLALSCLLPALSSYLRNDSVLDMARHIPLYRAVLQLLRAMARSNQLAPLLLPKGGGKSGEPSVVSLLSSMRVCVDTYVHKINRTRGNKSKTLFKYPDDTEQDEGLATLIPDIQESATIVQNSTARLSGIEEELPGPSPAGPELPLRSVEQRYLEVMKNLQFDTYEMIAENPESSGYKFAVSYHFESTMRAAGERSHPTRVKRLAQEAVTLSTALPLSYSSSVFVRCDTDRLDVMKVLITGPAETPYANGCFEFDVYFPPDYPNSPMLINLETTGRHTVRFNPNLYNDGKVCLSVLNTWHGRPEEKWNAHTSSFLQVLVSIQSLILVSEPYFNEPGYERSRGTTSGAQSSQEYNANICQATAKWAMLDQIRNPCPCFKEIIHTHFWIKRHEIVAQLEGWIRDMEMHGSDRRFGRTLSLNALALRRHYRLLREELNKLPTPEGLEDLVEPLASPGSPIELSGTPGIPNSPPTSTVPPVATLSTPMSNSIVSMNNASASNHVHHDIDTDVEMEKMVSKVCE
ncbi:baculoviral IAP repeat-containing protein 6 isoform X1 [Hylaeus anthracinus]|uniref:baculoviral IAP repeat-containing protein 6 isoform X1 n=1 Tax=Hylaeus anthracinus TaxID=313031 RepID=UPI0023B8C34B|nr:baculoviral IAP repeat-containing protein 6 isoform X1 [Hylaeus anthracinus]